MSSHFSLLQRIVRRSLAGIALVATLLILPGGQTAFAASTWNPTMLVNTESFQVIDEGDGTTNVEIRFGQTLNERLFYDRTNTRFEFTKGLVINGDTKVRGNLSGSTLNVDGASTLKGATTINGLTTVNANVKVRGSLSGSTLTADQLRNCDTIDTDANGNLVCGSDSSGISQAGADLRYVNTSGDTMTGALKVRANLSGSSLNIDGNAGFYGNITASGSFTTKGNAITINSGNNSTDDTLTFGNSTASQTLKYSHANQRFEFSKAIRVTGNISGSTLTVDGNLNWHGQSYTGPTSQTANGYLKTDGAGNLTWSTASIGNSSGGILSMHPEYPNAVLFASGSTYVGQMTASGGTSALDNSYLWTSSRATLQDYWIAIRVRVPDNFSSWAITPIQFKYKTGVASNANNHLTIRMKDTAGANVVLTGASGLASTTWATASVTGPEAGGTWTPKGYFTVYVKTAANSTAGANAAAGLLNFNLQTTTP